MEHKDTNHQRRNLLLSITGLALFTLVYSILIDRWRKLRSRQKDAEWQPPQPIFADIQGLTAEEASARQVAGQDNAIYVQPLRSKSDIWKYNTFSIFNFSLIGLALVQLLLGKPLDALISLGVMLLNITVNVVQELIAQVRLRDFVKAAQPKVTVIRDGEARSIDANNVVLEDMLVIGPGDQVLVDGELVGDGHVVVDESLLTGASTHITKTAGDQVLAGSFCVSGRVVCESQKVGEDRKVASLVTETQGSKEVLTPIEQIVNRVLRGLLVIVTVFSVILVFRYFQMDVGIPTDELINAANIIFSIAPAGLFFMILLTYTAGSADISKIGALVHRARSVESLAQVNTLCFARAGFLTGTRVDFKTIETPQDQEHLPESRIRQLLGDFVRSTSVDNLATKAITKYFEGTQREILEEAPLMSVYGWIALTFDDPDLKGIYVLGIEEALNPFLVKDESQDSSDTGQQPAALRQVFSRIGGVFNRANGTSEDLDDQETESPSGEDDNQDPISQDTESTAEQSDKDTKPPFFKRLVASATRLVRRKENQPEGSEIGIEESQQGIELLFAYYPGITSLYDESGVLYLPAGVIPLCRLQYSEHVRPEAVDTIKNFSQLGLDIKILSPDNPDRTYAMLKKAGLGQEDGISLNAISGKELSAMEADGFEQAAAANSIFGDLSPQSAARVVQALRVNREYVAVVGDGVNDVSAMRQADLAIAMHNSSQAAQGVADIILLEDSPNILQRVMDKGQRIVNGLLDVLKLYLTQVTYITLLIVAARLVAIGFPYQSAQASVISAITITIPAVGFTFWASPRVLNSSHLNRTLAFVVLPAAITIATAAMVAYYYFTTSTGDMFYAQLAVTYTLIGTGLLLAVFLKPPLRLLTGGAPLSHNWGILVLALVLLAAFLVLVRIPLAQEYLKVDVLQSTQDYLIIAGTVLVWALVLLFAWRVRPLGVLVPPPEE